MHKNSLSRIAFYLQVHRLLSSEAPKPAAKSGGGLLQRISSFFVGAGLTAIATQFYIFKELKEGNEVMIRKQRELEKRITKLES